MSKYLLLLVVYQFSISVMAFSDTESSPKSTIKRLIAYSKFGNGDVYVELNTNSSTCKNGYFINKTSAGYEATLSMLLAAYQANTPVILYGYKNNQWSGSSAPVCELYSVLYQR